MMLTTQLPPVLHSFMFRLHKKENTDFRFRKIGVLLIGKNICWLCQAG